MTEQEKLLQIKTAKTEGADYSGTMQALRAAEEALPDYTSSYDAEIRELYGKIVNRPAFTYSPSSDALYGVYRENYAREGRLAMRDTMGRAAALTGGYGSSYGQAVGQQQYDAYLQKLGDALPELYERAYERYRDEGDALENRLGAAQRLAQAEYDRARDRTKDAKDGMEMQNKQEQQNFERSQTRYKNLYELILKTGYTPSSEELESSGMSQAQAEALINEYKRTHAAPGLGAPFTGTGSAAKALKTKDQIKLEANQARIISGKRTKE